MKCHAPLSTYIVEDHFYPSRVYSDRKHAIMTRRRREQHPAHHEVIREHNQHLCCRFKGLDDGKDPCGTEFTRNFNILFIKEADLLFKNKNLQFNLDREKDIIKKKDNFIAEVSGTKSSDMPMTLSKKDKASYIDE